MSFKPHGSKNWLDLAQWSGDGSAIGRIILHDQEPCFLDMLDTYRDDRLVQKKSVHNSSASKEEELQSSNYYLRANITGFELIQLYGFSHPILCHSELNSDDIKVFSENGFIPCYYWWHGLTSRDWFRHWRFHADLVPKNNSCAPYRFLLYARATDGSRSYRTEVIDFMQQHKQQTLHNWGTEQVSSDASASIDTKDAANSCIHIVAETLFSTNKIYLTEKVFKPIVMSQPFIIIGASGSLSYMRDYGFKTFTGLWDESYDAETDHQARLKKIFALIDSLSSLSAQQLSDLYQEALPIIEFNRNYFFSDEFQSVLLNELHTNINDALRIQQSRFNNAPGEPCLSILNRAAEHGDIIKPWVDRLCSFYYSNNQLRAAIEQYPNLLRLLKQN